VDLALGRFTVVVGASNSGKSAFLRAIRALCANVSSPSIVTHGAKIASIEADVDDRQIGLVRGKARSEYVLDGEVYPKAGTSVPDPIAALLRMAPDEANFAFQFDRPYLLSDPATKVAQVLGELTNVNVVYDAVREANRRRLETAQRLKIREADVVRLEEKAATYQDLPAERNRLARMRATLTEVESEVADADRLAALMNVARLSSEAVVLLDDLPPLPDVDLGALEQMATKASRLESLVRAAQRSDTDATLADRDVMQADADREMYEQQLREVLVAAGTCPLCGQEITDGH
jgi:DNA repair ATPase RecN